MRRAATALVALALIWVPLGAAHGEDPALELVEHVQLSARLEELRVQSPAMGRELAVRVLTPAGFEPGGEPLPVLWLLHGGFGSASDWTQAGGAEALTEGLDLIVVMPEGGTGGWYADWLNQPTDPPRDAWKNLGLDQVVASIEPLPAEPQNKQMWETFHLHELRPFIEERYGTRTDRGGRAVAGLSMGGFGAMHYAARHPDLFGFAAAFSGAVDIRHPSVAAVVLISPLAHQGIPGDIFGLPVVHEDVVATHNPVDVAANLRDVEVQLRTGNGMPGGAHGGGIDVGELAVYQANEALHSRLVELGIPHVWDPRPGAHTWPYWHDHLRDTLPAMTDAFARTAPEGAAAE